MYDVVWYSPARRSDAERVLKRLSLGEAVRRDCPDLNMSSDGVPIPGQSLAGRCVCRNFIGASDCMPLGNTSKIADWCTLTDHGDGLVGGELKPEFWLSSELAQSEEIAVEREEMLRAMKPMPAGKLFRACMATLFASFALFIAFLCAIPRCFKKQRKRQIRSLAELEVEFARVFGALKRGI